MEKDDFIKATDRGDGMVETEIQWSFADPHEAGHVLGKLIKTLIQGFEPKIPLSRGALLQAITEGIECQIGKDFLLGDNSRTVILPIETDDLSKLN
jgi:hypothetical protein